MKVRIYKPSKTAMQSIHAKTPRWTLEFLSTTKKQPEPLMGWTSAGDTLGQVKLTFKSREDAIAYAERQGWEYTVTVERDRRVRPRNYGDNFRYIPPQEEA
ncbi:MAG TPA: ETC complex I subunit [Alphaproteobacteria bacterium]|nr:ETC complex I subunit [Alphaproteobacteria bacterium]